MKRLIYSMAILAMASFFLNGCGKSPDAALLKGNKQPPDTDVTSSPQYNFSSFAGTVWKTKVKTAILGIQRHNDDHAICLFPPEVFDPTDHKYSAKADMLMPAVLPAGTRLRIERLVKDNGGWGGVMVEATLVDGTNSQKSLFLHPGFLAKNQFIAAGGSSSTNWGGDPDMLEK